MESFLGVRIFFSLLINLEPNTPEYKGYNRPFFLQEYKRRKKEDKKKRKNSRNRSNCPRYEKKLIFITFI